jgi:hypothetical protein
MGRFVAKVLAVLIVGGGVAQAGGRHEKWRAVEDLAPGVPVAVAQEHGPTEECSVVAVDDAALTCERDPDPDVDWGPGARARVVFPRASVRAVWVWEPVPERHIGLWIASAVGFALGGAVCAVGGPGPIVACGALGALFAVAIIESAEAGPRYPGVWFPWPAPMPPIYPARPREMRQKLVYRAP